MSDTALKAVAWLALAAHVVVGVAAARRPTAAPLVPLLNLVVALCVVGYWAQRWYGYLAHGVTWHAADRLLPLAALAVCMLAGLTLAGRLHAAVLHWIVFGVDALAALAAVAFVTFFRMDRLF